MNGVFRCKGADNRDDLWRMQRWWDARDPGLCHLFLAWTLCLPDDAARTESWRLPQGSGSSAAAGSLS